MMEKYRVIIGTKDAIGHITQIDEEKVFVDTDAYDNTLDYHEKPGYKALEYGFNSVTDKNSKYYNKDYHVVAFKDDECMAVNSLEYMRNALLKKLRRERLTEREIKKLNEAAKLIDEVAEVTPINVRSISLDEPRKPFNPFE